MTTKNTKKNAKSAARSGRSFAKVLALFILFSCMVALPTVVPPLPACAANSAAFAAPATSASGAVLIEASSGRVLFAQNPDCKLGLASTTKIMTALVVIENCKLDTLVSVDPRAIGIEGSSVYLKAGERLTVRDLLYGLMLRSGNDCAVALALHTAGSIEGFCGLMNKTAERLGATNTQFANPHGLHAAGHYTTALDLAKISSAAMQNAEFRTIVSSQKAVIGSAAEGNVRHIANKNRLLGMYGSANGVKTGFTKKAGRCFVGSAEENGMQLVAVVLNCGPMFENARDMLKWGFENFEMANILPRNKLCAVEMRGGRVAAHYVCPGEFSYPLKKGESVSTAVKKEIITPYDGNTSTAQIRISYGGKTIYNAELLRREVN